MSLDLEPEFDEAAQVERVLVKQLPDPTERFLVLQRLIESADKANAIASNAWAATLFANGFRLNVGQVEAVVLVDGEFRVDLSGSVGIEPLVGSPFVAAGYRSLPQPLCALVGSLTQ